MEIGYIGLGNMGGALARRLLGQQGLHVYDINTDAVEAFTRQGAVAAKTPGDMATVCDIIFLCLPKSEHVRSVIFGPSGIASSAKRGLVIIDQTTGDPEQTRSMARELAQIGMELCDAPVSGGPNGAAAGTIALMVGASMTQFNRLEPLLRTIGPHVYHAGEVGAGQVIKLANNLLHHSQRLLSLEVVALAAKNGIDPKRAVDIILAGSGRNYFLQHNMHPRIFAGEMQSGFTLDLLYKDVNLATQMGVASAVPMPIANLVRDLYQIHISTLGQDAQVNLVATNTDRWSGTSLVPDVISGT